MPAPDPPMLLITGPVELLLRREAEQRLDAHREAVGGDLDVTDVRGPELVEGGLPDLRTGSLFGAPRAVLIREAQALPAAAATALKAELDGSPPEALVVLLATSTGRIQGLAKAIKDAGGRIDVAPPREFDHRGWRRLAADEVARHGRRIDDDAVDLLLDRAGTDVNVVAEKAAQVAAGAPPGTITAEHVDQLVIGHGSRGSFAVADAMCDRDPPQALTLLRGALAAGDDPIMILGALAYRVRVLAAVAGAERLPPPVMDGMVERIDHEQRSRAKDPEKVTPLADRGRDEQLCGVVSRFMGLRMSPGQLKHARRARRSFGPGELTAAFRVLADADAEMKGGELPAELVLERAVLTVADREQRHRPQRVVAPVARVG